MYAIMISRSRLKKDVRRRGTRTVLFVFNRRHSFNRGVLNNIAVCRGRADVDHKKYIVGMRERVRRTANKMKADGGGGGGGTI